MISLKRISTFGEIRLYHYWPEGDKTHLPGAVRVNTRTGVADLIEPAELDVFLYYLREETGERAVWRYFESVRDKLMQEIAQ